MSSRLDLVHEALAYGFGRGICKSWGASGKSCLLHGLLLKVLNDLVQLLKEDAALAFSLPGSASGVTVGPVENNTPLSDQSLGCVWRETMGRESKGRWPELSSVQLD